MRAAIPASLFSAAVIVGAGSAMAGGVVGPSVEASSIQVAPVMGAWEGAYAGGSLGYILGTDDEVSLAAIQDGEQIARFTNLGDVGVLGATVGLHGGYRWQRNNWVFGPELGIEFGSVDETISFRDPVDLFEVESKMNNIITLVLKTGYEVSPGTLVYGTFGVARGDFDYTLTRSGNSVTESFDAVGIAAGFGAERMINERTSIFAEYQYRDFGNESVSFDAGEGNSLDTLASMSMSTVKIGANFKF